jgi:hypothetical protein
MHHCIKLAPCMLSSDVYGLEAVKVGRYIIVILPYIDVPARDVMPAFF